MSNPVTPASTVGKVVLEMKTALQSIATLNNRVVITYSKEALIAQLKSVTLPAVGIVYEGAKARGEVGETSKLGVSNDIVVSLIVVSLPTGLFLFEDKIPIIDLLDEIRDTLLGMKSVTGHRWKFVVEAPAEVNNNLAFWVQRWSVPIQFPPK